MARTNSFTNPAINRVSKFADAFTGDQTASYKGITAKTLYFLATTVLGVIGFIVIHNYYIAENYAGEEISKGVMLFNNELPIYLGAFVVAIFGAIVSSVAPRTIPVTGTLYSVGIGYIVSFTSYTYAAAYKGIVLEALILTLVIIGVMLFLYTSGIVHVNQRMKTVVYTVFITSFIGGIIFTIMYWVAPNSSIVSSILKFQSGPIGVVFAIIGVIIGAFFLLFDFETIAQTVDHGLSKKYEWYCSFSLMVSVIYLYLKVLQLLARLQNNRR